MQKGGNLMYFATNHHKMEEFREICKNIRLLANKIERSINDEALVDGCLVTLESQINAADFFLSGISNNWAAKNSEFKDFYVVYDQIYSLLDKVLNDVRHKIVMSEKSPEKFMSYKNLEMDRVKKVIQSAKKLNHVMKEKSQFLTSKGKDSKKTKKSQIVDFFRYVFDSENRMDEFANSFAKKVKIRNKKATPQPFGRGIFIGADGKDDRVVNDYSKNMSSEIVFE